MSLITRTTHKTGLKFGLCSIFVITQNCFVVKDALDANGFKIPNKVVPGPDALHKHQTMKKSLSSWKFLSLILTITYFKCYRLVSYLKIDSRSILIFLPL